MVWYMQLLKERLINNMKQIIIVAIIILTITIFAKINQDMKISKAKACEGEHTFTYYERVGC